MAIDMGSVLTQMGILVFIMALGFFCTKIHVTGPAFTRSASSVVLNVFLVFTIINSVVSADLEMSAANVGWDILVFFIMVFICAAVGFVLMKLLNLKPDKRGLVFFCATFSNTVFVGFPVIESVYGADGVFIATLSNIAFNGLVYTLGAMMVRGNKDGLNIKSALSAPVVATIVSVAFFLTGIKLPEAVIKCTDIIGGATVPMSMLVVGSSLGSTSVRAALSDWRVYLVSAVRLIICPLICWLALRLFIHDELLLGVCVILASCPTAMIATMLAIAHDKNEAFASECVFVSTVFSAATMPLMIWLLL